MDLAAALLALEQVLDGVALVEEACPLGKEVAEPFEPFQRNPPTNPASKSPVRIRSIISSTVGWPWRMVRYSSSSPMSYASVRPVIRP